MVAQLPRPTLDLRYAHQRLSAAVSVLSLTSLDVRERVAGACVHALADIMDWPPPPPVKDEWQGLFELLAPAHPLTWNGKPVEATVMRAAIARLSPDELTQLEARIKDLARAVSAAVSV